jgi:hypothetical protein
MYLLARHGCCLLAALSLSACHLGEPRPSSAEAAKVSSTFEKFTGQVVKRSGEYYFQPLDHPEKIQRLSRSKNPTQFASDEIHLRKYYGKTLVVRGFDAGDWIAKAEVIGQWLRPGEPRGSTLIGPEPN